MYTCRHNMSLVFHSGWPFSRRAVSHHFVKTTYSPLFTQFILIFTNVAVSDLICFEFVCTSESIYRYVIQIQYLYLCIPYYSQKLLCPWPLNPKLQLRVLMMSLDLDVLTYSPYVSCTIGGAGRYPGAGGAPLALCTPLALEDAARLGRAPLGAAPRGTAACRGGTPPRLLTLHTQKHIFLDESKPRVVFGLSFPVETNG